MPDPMLDLIRAEIQQKGPITVARYMELALYHPELGYYRTHDRFGISGDFYTAEQLQPVFGELMATYVEQLATRSAQPERFGVLELGAGRAELRNALSRWRYRAFDWNTESLPVSWTGLVLANEFFDALPVDLLKRDGDSWREVLVAQSPEGLCYTSRPLEDARLLQYAREYEAYVPEAGTLEASLQVANWVQTVASFLGEGCLLVIDYGYDARELSRFPGGTLLSYQKHGTGSNILANPGQKDITAHVNFTWLAKCAEAAGFVLEKPQTLAAWMLSVWCEEELNRRWSRADRRWRLQWKQLMFGLGETFRVLQFRRVSKEK
jgi:SAM-dependent MidA family methyltransferase